MNEVDAVRPDEVLQWLREQAGFAQVITINRDGFPVARTVGAVVNEDWSVDLIQRRIHYRLGHLRRNRRLELVWVGDPAPGARNDHPAVFDFGRLVPRAVMLRGLAEFESEQWTLQRYRERTAQLRARGNIGAPQRSPANVAAELVGIRVSPVRVRAEGFGLGAQAFTWSIEELL